jgi:hypothetical protein
MTQVAQALEERGKSARLWRTWIERKEAEPRDPPRRLRLSGEGQSEHYEGEEKGAKTHHVHMSHSSHNTLGEPLPDRHPLVPPLMRRPRLLGSGTANLRHTPYKPRSSATKREEVRRLTNPAPSVVFCSAMISAAV